MAHKLIPILAISTVTVLHLVSALAPLHQANPIEKVPNSFIVVLKDAYTEVDLTDVIKRVEKGTTFRAKITGKFTNVYRGFSLEVSEAFVPLLRSLEEVAYVEEDSIAQALQIRTPWNLDRIDQRDLPLDDAFNPPGDGTGVNAYIVDTGIRYTHSEFGGRAVPFYDFESGDGSDCNGHGTHGAGVVGGIGQGVARNVQLHSVRVLNCIGSGTIVQIVGGLDYLATNGVAPGVASLAVGSGPSIALDNAVRGVITAGFQAAIAAGGSSANACDYSPSRIEEGITVAASDTQDSALGSSNTGPCVHIFAPGEVIRSAWFDGDSAYRTLTGTSSSAAHVAGVSAIILQNSPTFTPSKVKEQMLLDATAGRLANVPADTINSLVYTV